MFQRNTSIIAIVGFLHEQIFPRLNARIATRNATSRCGFVIG